MSLHYMVQGRIIKGFLSNHNMTMRVLVPGDMKLYNKEFSVCNRTYQESTKEGISTDMWRVATPEEIDIFKATALIEGVTL